MRFTCPSCSKSYRLSRERIGATGGAKIRCPNCKTLVRVQVGEGEKLIAQLAVEAGAGGVRETGRPVRPASAATAQAAASGPQPADAQVASPQASAPKVAAVTWHVAVNQKAQGPLTIAAIQALVDAKEVTATCLAWKKGLAAWQKIEALPELRDALQFAAAPAPAAPRGGTLKTGAAHLPGQDRGDAPTVMADVVVPVDAGRARTVPGGKAAQRKEGLRQAAADRGVSSEAIELSEARTLRPAQQPQPVRGGAMPRTKTSETPAQPDTSGAATAAPPAKPPTPAATAAKEAPAAVIKAPPAKAPEPTAAATKPADVRTDGATGQRGQGGAERSAKAPAKPSIKIKPAAKAAQPAKAVQPAKAAQPGKPGKTGNAGAKPGAQTTAKAGGAAQSMAFFESGEQLMADVEFDLPDPNKHKPTKEEYANLLQEFSVMFRLDKRSKRQKAGIVVVLTLLVVGVISFGVILYLQGQQRQALIRDSKTILAVFSLPYQTSETVNLSQEAAQESAEFGAATTKKAQLGTKQSSSLAEKLRSKIRGRRMDMERTQQRRPKAVARNANHPTFKVKSAAELGLGGMQANADAAVDARGTKVKRVEVDLRVAPTRSVLTPLCKGAMPDLRSCSKTHIGEAPYKAKVSVSRDGNVTGVSATVDGKSNAALSACAFGKMKRKRVGALTDAASITCAVD